MSASVRDRLCPGSAEVPADQVSGRVWRIDQLIEEAPDDAWHALSCGAGAKGPRVYDWAAARRPANFILDPDPPTHHRWVMARRILSAPSELAYAPVGVEIAQLARVAGSRWAVKECCHAAKNECGLALLARAAGASGDFAPMHLSAYGPLTVFGVVLGAIGRAVVRRVAKNPAGLLRCPCP